MELEAAVWFYAGGAACSLLREIVLFDSSKFAVSAPARAPALYRYALAAGIALALLLRGLLEVAAWPLPMLLRWMSRNDVRNADIGGAAMDLYGTTQRPPEEFAAIGLSPDAEAQRKLTHVLDLCATASEQRIGTIGRAVYRRRTAFWRSQK